MVQRMGRVIGINPKDIEAYKKLHADPWPEIIQSLKDQNIQNFSIFLYEPENLLFSYWEYAGTDFEADRAKGFKNELSKKWWALTAPKQCPLESRKEGEWWSLMEQVFFAE